MPEPSSNHRLEQYFGANEDEISGKTDYDYVAEHLADAYKLSDQLTMDTGNPSIDEHEIVLADDDPTSGTSGYLSNKSWVFVSSATLLLLIEETKVLRRPVELTVEKQL